MFYQSGAEATTAFVVNPGREVQDIRALEFDQGVCCLGSRKGVVYMSSIEQPKPVLLSVGSDVFSLHLNKHLLYTGARNGSVSRLDLRVAQGDRIMDILHGRHNKLSSSIIQLRLLQEWQLLVAGTNHQLDLFDTRFLKSGRDPIMTFSGYNNTYLEHLPVIYDSATDTIVAATQDCRLRAWSARTGAALVPIQKKQMWGRNILDPFSGASQSAPLFS